jgi:hypothetical protein
MTQTIINGVIALGLVVALTLGFAGLNPSTANLGGSGGYEALQVWFGNGFKVGPQGTAVNQLIKGTCSLIASSFTIPATTTVATDCAVTGVLSGDLVFSNFATSSAANGGWLVVSASASSTSGYITLRIQNNTGLSAVIPASLASGTPYLILR